MWHSNCVDLITPVTLHKENVNWIVKGTKLEDEFIWNNIA